MTAKIKFDRRLYESENTAPPPGGSTLAGDSFSLQIHGKERDFSCRKK